MKPSTPRGFRRPLRALAALLSSVLPALVLAQPFAQPVHRSIAIDGLYNDWEGVAPVFEKDLPSLGPGSDGGRLDFKNVYVTNDDEFLYVRFTLHFPVFVDWRYTLWINGDLADSAGFFSDDQPWKFRVNNGSGHQTVREGPASSGFDEGRMGNLSWDAVSGTRLDVEARVALSAVYGAPEHPDGTPNAYAGQKAFNGGWLYLRLTGNSVDDKSASTGAIRYHLAKRQP